MLKAHLSAKLSLINQTPRMDFPLVGIINMKMGHINRCPVALPLVFMVSKAWYVLEERAIRSLESWCHRNTKRMTCLQWLLILAERSICRLDTVILLRLFKKELPDNLHKIKGSEINEVDPLVLICHMYDLHHHELPWKSLLELLWELGEVCFSYDNS